MEFTKFPKMENLQTAISAKTADFAAAAKLSTKWIATEKIDGTNISLNITRDGFQFGSRNGLLAPDAQFYDVHDSWADVAGLVRAIKSVGGLHIEEDACDGYGSFPVQISLYGEFFGQNIMNRLKYGRKSRFRFYAMLYYYPGEKVWLPYKQFAEHMRTIGYEKMLVPQLAHLAGGLSFEEACAFPNDQKSRLCDDTMEGVVIWPADIPAFDGGHVYAFKNKNEAFLETSARKVRTPLTEAQQYARDMNKVFLEYLTESRMWSVFSKLGKADDDSSAGEYIKALLNDAWEEFVQDNPEVEVLDKAGIKVVRSGGPTPYALFKTVQAKMAREDADEAL